MGSGSVCVLSPLCVNAIRAPYHLVEDVAGQEVVLDVRDLHRHGDAVVVGSLL